MAPRGAAGRGRAGRGLRPRPRARRAAHQPRVRVGEPHRAPARRRRALGRGGRRAGQPAGRAGRGGAPRVLPERRRQPARHVRGVAHGARTRARAAGGRLPGSVPRRDGRAACAPSSATASPRSRRASGATATPCARLQDDLGRIGVHFDTWFSERTLHEAGNVVRVLDDLRGAWRRRSSDDGATWLRATDFGDQRDRVLVKSDGSTTYLCNDLAYHRDKFDRGWEHLIDIWGADHHGQVKSLQAGMEALGLSRGRARGAARSAGEADEGRRAGPHLEAHRQRHHPRRHPRRGRSRRRPPHVPAAGHRHQPDLRPRRRHRAVDGEPRLLRAVRARPHRLDRPARDRARASRAARCSTRRWRRWSTNASSTCCARSRRTPACSPRRPSSGRPTASPPGCATSPSRSTASTATAG